MARSTFAPAVLLALALASSLAAAQSYYEGNLALGL